MSSWSAEGAAREVSSLMVILSRLQLDALGSDDSSAWGGTTGARERPLNYR